MELLQLDRLKRLRQELHATAELSGTEIATARLLVDHLRGTSPDHIIKGLGGRGLAFIYGGQAPGPRIGLRADMDALPQIETSNLPYASRTEGTAHKCGHDGHMAILAGVASALGLNRPRRGEIVLLFQPAEETGEGASLVLSDSRFDQIRPDWIFALHNLPGFELGDVVVCDGPFASASIGIAVELEGATSHAAEPQEGRSPALAVAELIQRWSSLPQFHTALHEAAQVTIVHAQVGEVAFGTSPGQGSVMATLRAHKQSVLDGIRAKAEDEARRTADAYGLRAMVRWVEPFPATDNHPFAAKLVRRAAREAGAHIVEPEHPFPWSEDFGAFTAQIPGALFGLGAGAQHPALHAPQYDFPDALLEVGVDLMLRIIDNVLNLAPGSARRDENSETPPDGWNVP